MAKKSKVSSYVARFISVFSKFIKIVFRFTPNCIFINFSINYLVIRCSLHPTYAKIFKVIFRYASVPLKIFCPPLLFRSLVATLFFFVIFFAVARTSLGKKIRQKKPTATTLWRACGSGQAQKKRGCFYICHIPYFILLIVGKYFFRLGLSLFLLSPGRQCVACHLSRRLPLRPPFGPALYLALHAAWLKAVITNSKTSKNSNKNKQIALTMFLASIGFFLFLRKLI